jgi:hypothetical protein
VADKVFSGTNIKIAGFALFIPLVMVTGPLFGYMAGEFLAEKFKLGNNIVTIFTVLGFVSGITETFKIIKRIIKLDASTKKREK